MSARDEAIKAIEHVEQMLTSNEPMTLLQKKIAAATLEHARENVLAIQETRRPRKGTKTP